MKMNSRSELTNQLQEDVPQSNRGLIIFLRAPELGKVKTRLAATVGDVKALTIYQTLTEIALDVSAKVAALRLLYFYPYVDKEIASAHSPGFRCLVQKGSDLGEKMSHAFDECLKQCDKAVIIGTDCPYIQPELIEEAFLSLDQVDIVIGPAIDGGYYLLGMKKFHQSIFTDVPWSTDRVLEETLKRIEKKGLRYLLLATLSDIDLEEDWISYIEYKRG